MKNAESLCSKIIRATLISLVLWGIVFCVELAQAEPIIGKLRNYSLEQPLELVLLNSKKVVTIEGRPEIVSYLRGLSTGDSISGSGRFSNDGKRVYLDSLDRVGLQELLGAWRAPTREIFEFKNYDTLNVYVPTVNNEGDISLAQTRSLKYVLTPEKGNRFSIFMSDKSGYVRLGFIHFQKRKLEMILTDSNTGQLKERISLWPFYLP